MQKIGIGYENYKKIIEDNCYYVDKTLLVRDVVKKSGMVTLFTRPRRFGKTLALSTMQTFFEQEYDRDGNLIDKKPFFIGKKIMEAEPEILDMMGKYPVISLSLKSAKQDNFETAFIKIREDIIREYRRHSYLKESDALSDGEKRDITAFCETSLLVNVNSDMEFQNEIGKYNTSLKFLSECLKKHHGADVIILLDEYDVPLENAYYKGFYDEMVGFIRSLFESALKTNDALKFAVVTGCLRISKESIFTGMNNLVINSIRGEEFQEGFGFTPEETEQMLADYGISEKVDEVRRWYNGYIFGNREIYNPWSVINYVYEHVSNPNRFPEPYWANTSSNQIIRDMVYHADDKAKEQLDLLIRGGTIEKQIHEDITYNDIHDSEDNLWNFLFFTGYMKKVSERSDGDTIYVTMKIPNIEIRSIYRNQIRTWFDEVVRKTDLSTLHQAVLAENTEQIGDFVSTLLRQSISTFDADESFYHGFFLSLLYGVPNYTVQSNREEGIGRPDIVLYPVRPQDPAIIFEVKTCRKFSEMQDGLEEAYKQIREKKYAEGILDDGYIGSKAYGICFCKKSCVVGRFDG